MISETPFELLILSLEMPFLSEVDMAQTTKTKQTLNNCMIWEYLKNKDKSLPYLLIKKKVYS
jgi:hypothetical protein